MALATVVFHVLQALADAAAIHAARRPGDGRVPSALLVLVASIGTLGVIVGRTLEGDAFAILRLWCWGLYLHVPLALLAMAWLRRGRSAVVAVGAALLLELVALDAFVIEPRALRVVHHTLVLPDAPRALTIAVLSDIQTDHVTEHERRALEAARDERPDLILLPGDFVQTHDPAQFAEVQEALAAVWRDVGLDAPLGAFAVKGNVDHLGPWTRLFDGLPVSADERTITRELAPGLHLTSLSFGHSFDTAVELPRRDGLHIVVGHGPDFALAGSEADLLVAGHTHGGQIRLPGFGPIFTLSEVPRAWAEGLTWIRPDQALLVSRGIGMERGFAPRLRFLCPPEVVILHVTPR